MVRLICVRSVAFEYRVKCEFLLCKYQERSLLSIYIVSFFLRCGKLHFFPG